MLLPMLLAAAATAGPQTYTRLDGDIVFQNEDVVAQHFLMVPGATTGMHQHQCVQMEILLSTGKGEVVVPGPAGEAPKRILLDMKKGDLRYIEPSDEQHDFVNIDDKPIEWILLTMKKTCRSAPPAQSGQ